MRWPLRTVAGSAGEAVDPSSPCAAAEVGVRRVPVPPEVIVLAVRWYLRFDLSSRDVGELAERGIEVDHVLMRPNSSGPSDRRTSRGPTRRLIL